MWTGRLHICVNCTKSTNSYVSLSTGAAVALSGDWRASPGAEQSHELNVTRVQILGENDAESNLVQPKYQTAEYLRTIPHLRPRIPANALLLRLRSQLIASLTRFFAEEDFVQTHAPIITSCDCEGAGEVFTVSPNASKSSEQRAKPGSEAHMEHFFRGPKYLTVSAQLHLEALAQAVNKVWTLSPTFRAEQSDTPRHLSEFYMLEAEMCFTQNLNDVMGVVETMLRSAVLDLLQSRVWTELMATKQAASRAGQPEAGSNAVSAEILQQRWHGITASDWPRITYEDAIKHLQTAHAASRPPFSPVPQYDVGLSAEQERYLASTIGKGSPVFVTHYPQAQKPFYMSPSPLSTSGAEVGRRTVECFDLLVPDLCELAGGSLREHRSKELAEAMQAKGVNSTNLEWYQDLRKYGSVPHGGFGLGFDRLLAYLSGVSNVRDVVAFPRWYGRCEC